MCTFHFSNWGWLSFSPNPTFLLLLLLQQSALCSCSSVVVCLSRSFPPPLAHVNLAFRHTFFHCSPSLFLIKVKKHQLPLLLSLSRALCRRRHFILLCLSFSLLTFHTSLFRPRGSWKTSLSVFVERSGRNILKRYCLPLCYDHCKTTFLFERVCRSMQGFIPMILRPLSVPAVEITDVDV